MNPNAVIRRSRYRVAGLVEVKTGREVRELAGERLLGFCGLGNPDAFRRSLRELGEAGVPCLTFADHHRYAASDVARIVEAAREHKATALVTTEKDLMNLQRLDGRVAALFEVPLYWLRIECEVDEADGLVEEIVAGVESRIGASGKAAAERRAIAELSYSG